MIVAISLVVWRPKGCLSLSQTIYQACHASHSQHGSLGEIPLDFWHQSMPRKKPPHMKVQQKTLSNPDHLIPEVWWQPHRLPPRYFCQHQEPTMAIGTTLGYGGCVYNPRGLRNQCPWLDQSFHYPHQPVHTNSTPAQTLPLLSTVCSRFPIDCWKLQHLCINSVSSKAQSNGPI